jgi:hypothetical protein
MTYASPANEHWYAAATSGKTVPLLGPYPDHGQAAAQLDRARAEVRRRYPNDDRAHFASYGVARVVTDTPPASAFGI